MSEKDDAFQAGWTEGRAHMVDEIEGVLREHGLINTREALADLRAVIGSRR